jgi:hypothetical protein
MATIIYPNTDPALYVNMGHGYEIVRTRSSQGISKAIAVKTNINSGDRIHKGGFYYPGTTR